MRRPSLYLGLGLLVLIVAGVLTALALFLQHEPGFYVRAGLDEGPTRKLHSTGFVKESFRFVNEVTNQAPTWHAQFTETQINSFFKENFLSDGYASKLLPEGVSDPRVAFEQDRLRIGFRYGTAPWSTIVSVDFKVWLPLKERNAIVLQLQGLHAGALPISAQSLLEQLCETLRKNNIDVTWYRHETKPTALLRFQGNQARATVQLQQLELRSGTMMILGTSLDPAARPSEHSAKTLPSTPVETAVK